MFGFSNVQERLVAGASALAISFILFAGSVMPLGGAAMPYAGMVA